MREKIYNSKILAIITKKLFQDSAKQIYEKMQNTFHVIFFLSMLSEIFFYHCTINYFKKKKLTKIVNV